MRHRYISIRVFSNCDPGVGAPSYVQRSASRLPPQMCSTRMLPSHVAARSFPLPSGLHIEHQVSKAFKLLRELMYGRQKKVVRRKRYLCDPGMHAVSEVQADVASRTCKCYDWMWSMKVSADLMSTLVLWSMLKLRTHGQC